MPVCFTSANPYIRSHDVEYIVRGEIEAVSVDWRPNRLITLKFPDKSSVQGYLNDLGFQVKRGTAARNQEPDCDGGGRGHGDTREHVVSQTLITSPMPLCPTCCPPAVPIQALNTPGARHSSVVPRRCREKQATFNFSVGRRNGLDYCG
jgi:uncharacterized protein (DUF1330 family)